MTIFIIVMSPRSYSGLSLSTIELCLVRGEETGIYNKVWLGCSTGESTFVMGTTTSARGKLRKGLLLESHLELLIYVLSSTVCWRLKIRKAL